MIVEQKIKRKLTDEKSRESAKEKTNLSSVTEVDRLYHVFANIIYIYFSFNKLNLRSSYFP